MKKAVLFALLAAALCAWGEDAPRRKSGLWEMTMRSDRMPQPTTVQQCIDQKTDDLSRQGSSGQQHCSKTSVRRESGRVVVESECKVENSIARTRAVLSGDFASSYSADVATTFAPPLHGIKEQKATLQARWVSPCKPGQKPGDVAVSGVPAGSGKMDPETARRMADEMRKRYQK